jgi:urease accessory protein
MMLRDGKGRRGMRGKRPFGLTDLSRGKGVQEIVDFIIENGGLRLDQPRKSA